MTTQIVWLSLDPVRKQIDYYPAYIANMLENSYNNSENNCHLGREFFNATVHFNTDESNNGFYQTTNGAYTGRGGFKPPGYRCVKRIILDENNRNIQIYSTKTYYNEWRIIEEHYDSMYTFNLIIPDEFIIIKNINITHNSNIDNSENSNSENSNSENSNSENSNSENSNSNNSNSNNNRIINIDTNNYNNNNNSDTISYWKPEDLENDNKLVAVWKWCRGVPEQQGNVMVLGDSWWIPYLQHQNEIIETAFKNNELYTEITLDTDNSTRTIAFNQTSCYAYQRDFTNNNVRCVQRVIISIRKLKELIDLINNLPIDSSILSRVVNNSEEIPHEFYCCISQNIMSDPVKTIDGHTYDRSSIERWFQTRPTSPLTGLLLESTELTPNVQLQQQIKEYIRLKMEQTQTQEQE